MPKILTFSAGITMSVVTVQVVMPEAKEISVPSVAFATAHGSEPTVVTPPVADVTISEPPLSKTRASSS
jgi:hypothetical protein